MIWLSLTTFISSGAIYRTSSLESKHLAEQEGQDSWVWGWWSSGDRETSMPESSWAVIGTACWPAAGGVCKHTAKEQYIFMEIFKTTQFQNSHNDLSFLLGTSVQFPCGYRGLALSRDYWWVVIPVCLWWVVVVIQPDVEDTPNSTNPTNTEGDQHLENRFKKDRVAVFCRECGKQKIWRMEYEKR